MCFTMHHRFRGAAVAGIVMLAGLGGCQTATSAGGGVRVEGRVLAGPACPIQPSSPQAGCADRAVADAALVITDAAGREVSRTTSGQDGRFGLVLEPGSYRLVPQPVEGLPGTPEPLAITVRPEQPLLELTVTYDTGIR